ncbi:MAG: hypothetical protein HQK77_20590 [Desulfobacterales bacterium]|nr:hypothetical protein [Desulfobacterales bacterium]
MIPTQPIPNYVSEVLTDRITFCMREFCDMLIHCVIRFNSHIHADQMEKAFHLCMKAEPILGCRILDSSSFKMNWLYRQDLDTMTLCPVRPSHHLNQDINQFLIIPMDPFQGPQVQAVIFRDLYTDTLCIKVNHGIADAGGVKELVYLLAALYNKLSSDTNYQPPLNKGSRSLKQIYQQFSMIEYITIFQGMIANLKTDSFALLNKIYMDQLYEKNKNYRFWTLPLPYKNQTDRSFVIKRIEPELFRAMHTYAKSYQATLNDIMVTAFFRALYRMIQPDPMDILNIVGTVDLRRYLPQKKAQAICNMSGFVHVNIGRFLGNTFQDTLIRVRNRMNTCKQQGYMGLYDFPSCVPYKFLPFSFVQRILSSIFNHVFLGDRILPPSVTNMGIIHLGKHAFSGLEIDDAFLTAPVLYPQILGIGLSGFQESLTMSCGFCGSEVNRAIVNQLFEWVVEELVTNTKCPES